MNPQIKQKWVSALRSGKYQQTKNRLHNEYGFCCLGVLCDLYGKENNVEWEISEDSGKYMFQNKGASLPSSVRKWADLEYLDPYVNYKKTNTLVGLNDMGFTFNEIADLIEEHL